MVVKTNMPGYCHLALDCPVKDNMYALKRDTDESFKKFVKYGRMIDNLFGCDGKAERQCRVYKTLVELEKMKSHAEAEVVESLKYMAKSGW